MKKTLILLFVGICLGIVISLGSAEMVQRTSGAEFCSKCHSMKAMVAAYEQDVHSGKNYLGIRAQCTDCHLPHDNVVIYMKAKAYTGIKDVLGEIFWADEIDWIANLKRREEYTYSNGCQKCHNLDLIESEADSAHTDFKTGEVNSCVECHKHVGHNTIKTHL